MKKLLFAILFFVGIISVKAQDKELINNESMETIRLIYPQWQGGIIAHWLPDIPAVDAAKGYYLGAQLLNMLAPQSSQKVVEVPVSLEVGERVVENGMSDYRVILKQTRMRFLYFAIIILKE